MTTEEFNEKWSEFLESGHYGMDIGNQEVIRYMGEEFTKEVGKNPSFSYSQIKLKMGMSRVYANSDKTREWEKKIDQIINPKN